MMQGDEEFARRLQAQEMGLPTLNPNENAPMRGGTTTTNMIYITRSTHVLLTVLATVLFYGPQIIAASVILSRHWNDPPVVCDAIHEAKWKFWSLVSAIRMLVFSVVLIGSELTRTGNSLLHAQFNSVKNVTDGFGLVVFIIGNLWLLGDDECQHPDKSPVFNLGLALLIINYIWICLPCIIVGIVVPCFCFCMPCIIRLLAWINPDVLRTAGIVYGADASAISTVPSYVIGSDNNDLPSDISDQMEDRACPICLNDMVDGDEVRLLPCKHVFHKDCVDEWLRVNATCPTCRHSLFPNLSPIATVPPIGGNRSVSASSSNNSLMTSYSSTSSTPSAVSLSITRSGGAVPSSSTVSGISNRLSPRLSSSPSSSVSIGRDNELVDSGSIELNNLEENSGSFSNPLTSMFSRSYNRHVYTAVPQNRDLLNSSSSGVSISDRIGSSPSSSTPSSSTTTSTSISSTSNVSRRNSGRL